MGHPRIDRFRVNVPEGNLEDDIGEDPSHWPQWKRDRVREMLHEYAVKGL